MRLSDLDAHFIGNHDNITGDFEELPSLDHAQGVMFQCPKCAENCEQGETNGRKYIIGAHYIICWFLNPKGAEQVPDDVDPKPGRWNAEGTCIDYLSFVGPQAASVFLQSGCGWHGFVKNGDAT